MSYLVLARKYRPQRFEDLVGQDHVARTLSNAIGLGRVHHAFLFTGARGVGKTSSARILAKALNCAKSDGPTTTPCLKCESCLAIARGEDIDVIEIDAASNTGVDNVRSVIENSQYRPVRSRFKIYIIDEVHMLSKQAFNALLKTLEEPPSHVKFILATTEPEKVLPTIHSRCQRYDFRNIPTREIAGHLKNVCRDEKIEAEEEALLLVAKSGAGSMRDALSLLDRLLSIGEMKLTVDTLEQMLGLPKSQRIHDLVQAIGEGRVKDVLTQADKLVCEGLSADSLVGTLIDHLRNLLVIRTCGPDSTLVEAATLSLEELNKQAQCFEAATLSQDITVLEDLRRQMKQVQAGRALLDATLVRLSLSAQFTSIADLLERVDSGTATAVQKKKYEVGQELPVDSCQLPVTQPAATTVPKFLPTASGTGSDGSPSRPGSSPSDASGERTAGTDGSPSHPGSSPSGVGEAAPPSTIEESGNDDLPSVGRVWEGETRSLGAMFKAQRTPPAQAKPAPADVAPEPSNVGPVDPDNLPMVWQQVLAKFSENHGILGVLKSAKLAEIGDDVAVVLLGPQHATFVSAWSRNGKKDQVAEALTGVLDRPVGVRFDVDAAASTPLPASLPADAARPEARNDSRPEARRPAPARPDPEPPAAPVGPAFTRPSDEQKKEYEADPLVREIMNRFGAEVGWVSEEEHV